MSAAAPGDRAGRRETAGFFGLFLACLGFSLWGMHVGWESYNLPGLDFRQAQTAISAYYIQQNHDFSLAYPTPVLGKPWSVPMEFPLYQWTVVRLSDWTGLDLTKAGRAVSAGCFLLCLPAVFQLLGRMGVAPGRRWLVLAVIVTCPLYMFFARAFLMETMALMFSLWFWVGFDRVIETRRWRWLWVAALAGSGAGLVKVTTFIVFLLPAGWGALQRLWRSRTDGHWRRDLGWMGLAVVGPCAVTLWWLHVADATKALNPSAQFLREANLRDVTLGSWAARLSPQLWQQQWAIITRQLSWAPLLGGGVVLMIFASRRRAIEILRLVLWFVAPLALFPVLYARHEYYFIANAVLLLMAAGLILVGLSEKRHPLWLVLAAGLAITGGQAYRYLDGYYLAQRGISSGGDGLTRSLRGLTNPDEVLVITGQDWNPMIPYYAQRRALMIRAGAEQDTRQLDAAFAALVGEKIGAFVLGPDVRGGQDLLRRVVAAGIDPQPLYHWRDVSVHLPLARRQQSILHLLGTGYDALTWDPGVTFPPNHLAGAWLEVQSLRPYQQKIFSAMSPRPVRFFSTFGPVLNDSGGEPRFGAHPVTRLVFRLPPGVHQLSTTACIAPEAYAEALPVDQRTDGVELVLAVVSGAGTEPRVLNSWLLDPRGRVEDRGVQVIKASFALDQAAEVELLVGPGPRGRDTRDWVWLGRLVIN